MCAAVWAGALWRASGGVSLGSHGAWGSDSPIIREIVTCACLGHGIIFVRREKASCLLGLVGY